MHFPLSVRLAAFIHGIGPFLQFLKAFLVTTRAPGDVTV